MIGILKYLQDFAISLGESQMWVKDTINNDTGEAAVPPFNTGYVIRKQLAQGKVFAVTVPLNHILGFADSYDKVIYGAKHTLIVPRSYDKLALTRAASSNTVFNGATEVAANGGKASITGISWYFSKIVPKPSVQENILA